MPKCNDCNQEADPKFRMDYTDVEPDTYLHWCSTCGPMAHMLEALIQQELSSRPEFANQLEKALDQVENQDSQPGPN